MLFRTSPAEDGHTHIAYKGPQGTDTGVNKGHSHYFTPKPPKAPGDPAGGLPVCSPGPDGHTHDLGGELYIDESVGKPKRETHQTVVADVRRLFKDSKRYEEDSRKAGEESEEFIAGNQWEEATRQELDNQKRACLTLNEIEPKIDLLSGYQRQNRSDIKYLPVEGGDAKVADVLNVVVKNICDQSDFEFEETEVFEDGLISGRGFFHVYVDNDSNLEGDIVIESWPWKDVYLGPHRKFDLSDCEYLTKSKWFSEAKIEQMFPDKFDKIRAEYAQYLEDEEAEERSGGEPEDDAKDYPDTNKQVPDPDFVDVGKKQVRVMECWRKVFERVPIAVNLSDNFFQSLKGLKKVEIAEIKTIPGLRVLDRKVDKVRRTVVAGSAFISDEFISLYKDYSIVPFYAKKRGRLFWGKVEPAKDPQREINKRASQCTDILNKVAAYGWFFDSNTFRNKGDERRFKAQSSKPGFVQEVKNLNNIPHAIDGVKFPNEIVGLWEVSSMKLREIMNINPELLGLNSKAESGIAQIEKKRQGLIGNEFLFDNMDRAKKKLGRVLIKLIQEIYNPERIARVVTMASTRGEVKIGNKPYDPSQEEAIAQIVSNTDLAKYDVAVTESAFSPTARRANFIAWGDLARNGFPVPPELLIDLSDLPDKDKVKEMMKAQMEAQAQSEQRKYDTEIEKARIARGEQTVGPGTSA